MTKQEFQDLYQEYWFRLYRFAMKYVTREDAEDVVADSFIALWNTGKDIKEVKSYLFATVKNRCLNHLNKKQWDFTPEENDHDEILETVLLNEVNKMKGIGGDILKLTVEGKSNKEISALLHMPDKTVRNRKWEAIQSLREIFRVKYSNL